ncbi:hypothetical protein HEM48_025410 [Escherichia coli]|nr:hypothetical protein [Escherichia coli]
MRTARFTEHQIIAVIKSIEAGRIVKDEPVINGAIYMLTFCVLPSILN